METADALAHELEAVRAAVRARRRLPPPSRLRTLRQRAGLPQTAVARLLGTTPPTVCRWEAGLRVPRGAMLARYLELLDRLADEASSAP